MAEEKHWYKEFPDGSFLDERAVVYGLFEEESGDGASVVYRVGMYMNVEPSSSNANLLQSYEYTTREEAEQHIRYFEPHSDIITLDGEPIPWDLPVKDCYEPWLKWLRARGLTSALDSNHRVPDYPIAQPKSEESNQWFTQVEDANQFLDDRMVRFLISDLKKNEASAFRVELKLNIASSEPMKCFDFDTYEEMQKFIELHEPRTFLVSLDGQRLDFGAPQENAYGHWLEWLHERGLTSSIEDYENRRGTQV